MQQFKLPVYTETNLQMDRHVHNCIYKQVRFNVNYTENYIPPGVFQLKAIYMTGEAATDDSQVLSETA